MLLLGSGVDTTVSGLKQFGPGFSLVIAHPLPPRGGSGMPSVQGMLDYFPGRTNFEDVRNAANKRASYGFTCGNGTRMRT